MLRRRTIIWGLFSLALCAGLVALMAIFGLLNEPARRFLEALGSKGGAQLKIGGLEGNPLHRFRLSQVAWEGKDGERLGCGELTVVYRPAWLLLGRVEIDSLKFISPQAYLSSSRRPTDDSPQMDVSIEALVVDRGLLSIGGRDVLADLSLDLGLWQTSERLRLQLRRLQMVVFDPPIELTDLSGLALRDPRQLVLKTVRVRTPLSSGTVDGTISWGKPPTFDLSIEAESLSAEEVGQLLGADLGDAQGWGSGTVEGPADSLAGRFDWVVGSAAGDLAATLDVWGNPKTIDINLTGRDVSLAPILGIAAGGKVAFQARLVSKRPSDSFQLKGAGRLVMSPGQLFGFDVDVIETNVSLERHNLEGRARLTDDGGSIAAQFYVDTKSGVGWLGGAVDGLNAQTFGGPSSRLGGKLDLSLDPEGTQIDAVFSSVTIGGRPAGSLDVAAEVVDGHVRLGSLAWTGPEGSFELNAEGTLLRALEPAALDLALSGRLGADVWSIGPPSAIALKGRLFERPTTYGGLVRVADLALVTDTPWFGADSVRLVAEVAGGRFKIDTLTAVGPNAEYRAEGSVVLDRAWDLTASGDVGDLTGFPVPPWITLAGQGGRINAGVVGAWNHPDVHVTVSSDTLRVRGAPLGGANLRFHRTDRTGISLRAESFSWGRQEIRGLYADVLDDAGVVSFLVGNKHGQGDRVHLWGEATHGDDSLSIRVDSVLVKIEDVTLTNRGPGLFSWAPDRGLNVQRVVIEEGVDGSITARSRDDSARTVEIAARKIDLRPWAFLAGAAWPVAGVVSGDFAAGGTVKKPILSSNVVATNLRLGDYAVDSVKAEASYAGGEGRSTVEAWSGEARVYVNIDIPVDTESWSIASGREDMDVAVTTIALPLSYFEGHFGAVTNLAGSVDADVWFRGPSDSVTGSGTASLSDGRGQIAEIDLSLADVQAEIVLSDSGFEIDRFRASSGGGGQVEVTGRIGMTPLDLHTLSGLRIDQLDLALVSANFRVVGLDELNGNVDVDLRLTGALNSPMVAGNVVVRRAEVRLPDLLEGPPNPESVWRTVAFFKNLGSEVRLDIPRQVWLRDDNLNVEITGDVDLLRGEKGVTLFGSLSSLRGTYRFQNRNFRIERGQIDFTGRGNIDPDVSIVGVTRIPLVTAQEANLSSRVEVDVRVIVGGTITQPEITLESDSGEDQAGLLSYIVLGRPPDDFLSGQQGTIGDQSAGLVVGLAANQLKERIGRQLNLDVLQVEMGGGTRVARVQVGKYIGDRIFVSYDEPIGTEAREFVVEYELLPKLTLESRVGFTDEGGQQSKLFMTWRKDW